MADTRRARPPMERFVSNLGAMATAPPVAVEAG